MADSPLIIKSKAFALDVIQVCKELRMAKCESALINQFLRPCRRRGRITCEQVKTVDNCFHDAIPRKARSIVREAVPSDRDDYATRAVVVGSNRNDASLRLPYQPKKIP